MESQISPADILNAIKRRRKSALIAFFIVLVASLSYALFAAPTYRSSATILIEQQEIPQDLVRSTVTSFADQRIQMTIQRVMTFAKLSQLIKKYDLYPEEREKEPLELVVEMMREDINHRMISAEVVDPRSGRPMEATIAFNIAYNSESAKTAQTVANELTSLFLKENIKNRTEMAEEAESFLSAEVVRLRNKSQDLEQKLSDFKEKNLRKLPELTTLNLNLMDRAEREYSELSRQIKALEERKVYLESQLNQQSPHANTVGDGSQSVLTPEARAKLLQNRYISLLAKYSEKHPDVVKTKRQLDNLLQEVEIPNDSRFISQQTEIYRAQMSKLLTKYDSEHPDVKSLASVIKTFEQQLVDLEISAEYENDDADNPAYVQLAASLEAAKVELLHLKASQTKVKKKLDELEISLLESPNVEREYRSLARDYENTARKYQEVKAKQLEASLAMSLEQERKGERFTLIEPPLLPVKPVKPNRILIAVAGVVMSFVMAGGLILLLEKVDQTIRSGRALQQFTGAPPLAVIPHIVTLEEVTARKRMTILLLGLSLAGVVGVTMAVHYAFMPLDVLWYVALRKLG
ncbi:MAG: Wzz/FepE/Etk N-terminal domain-containing protein [Pseudomonadales bacterium]|nr:Wzz/FepE/Etk N-terminal domain-containing protein [Pseudomonadales bacterium]